MTIEGGEASGGTQGRQGAFLSDHVGQGVYYDDDAWFTYISPYENWSGADGQIDLEGYVYSLG